METGFKTNIIPSETLPDGLILTFENGKCRYYSTSLRYAAFSQAEEIQEAEDDE